MHRMNGLIVFDRDHWESKYRPYFREIETSRIISVGELETIVFHMGKGLTGCFQAVPGENAAEVYYIISGKVCLKPLDEAEEEIKAGGFFAFHNRNDGTVFSVLEDTEMICFTNLPKFDANKESTVLIDSMLEELQVKDGDTRLHGERVRFLIMRETAHLAGFDGSKLEMLLQAARFHDIGKCQIPLEILIKPGKLTDEEYEIIKKHSAYGAEIVKDMFNGEMSDVLLHHHEWYDGTGYPDGLKGDEIPMCSRVIAVAGAYDAMVTERPYHKAISSEKAIEELRRCSGTQFDPDCAEALIAGIEDNEDLDEDDLIIRETKRQNFSRL